MGVLWTRQIAERYQSVPIMDAEQIRLLVQVDVSEPMRT